MKTVSLIISFIMLLSPACRAAAVSKKYVALTFDDGPHFKYTAQILHILSENNVCATFFVVGENAEKYPELVKAEYDTGHEIGNHTYSHKRLGALDCKAMLDEIKKADEVIFSITGEYPRLFRPPEGKTDKDLEAGVFQADKRLVLWSVDTRDWAHTPKDKIIDNIKRNVKDGSIILFHDYIAEDSPTPDVLKSIIPYLKSEGYEFLTVSELLSIKAYIAACESFFIG